MTEPRLADLFTGIHAFTRLLIEQSSADAEDAEVIRRTHPAVALRLERRSRELASGIEVLNRLAGNAQDDTQDMDLQDVADAPDT